MEAIETPTMITSIESTFNTIKSSEILNATLRALRIIPSDEVPPRTANDLPEITLKEVSNHDDMNDCWIVIYDRVYDVTNFLLSHPGGEWTILDYAGRDATLAFRGTGHSKAAVKQLEAYLIGELPASERIFRKTRGVFLTGVPE